MGAESGALEVERSNAVRRPANCHLQIVAEMGERVPDSSNSQVLGRGRDGQSCGRRLGAPE